MKNLQFLIVVLLMWVGSTNAQPMNFNKADYTSEWKEIQALEDKGLPKSALEKVELLFAKATKENNPSQIIKTTIYRAKYGSALEEDGFVKAVAKMRADMDVATFPTKHILESMLAQMYAGYLENNVWQFRNRTTTVNFKTDDMRTWTIEQLNDEAATLHRLAVNDDRSKNVEITNFNAITTEGTDALRPTLFDFLAHRAVDFFTNDKSYLAKPSYKFELDTEGSLLPADEFVNQSFESKDSSSGKLWALRLLQDLTRFHLTDTSPEALVDVDLKRLEFVYNNSILDIKDATYVKALEFLQKKFTDSPSYVEIALKLAQYYRSKAENWTPNEPNKALKNSNKLALELARAAIKKFPKAYGVKSCKDLINQITESSIELRLEEVVAPNKPILANISFKNTDSVFCKVIRLYERVGRREFEDDDQRLKYYNNLPFVARKNVKLPNEGDFNGHATEFRIDKLPLGMYLVLTADNPKFTNKNGGKVHYATFHVSNIAYFHRSGDTEANQFVIVDRSTGEPLPSVTVEFWENKYDQKLRKDVRSKIGNAVSDAQGFVYPRMPKEKYYTLRFVYGKDTLATGDGYSNYFYKPEQQKYQVTQFFLDRAMYRPSQTVHFKGILIERNNVESANDKTTPRIVPNEVVEVTFSDVNHQKITSLSLKTNQFGTFNGTFTAPSSGLLGNMSIRSNKNGAIYFKVEEYKRPKFEVKIEPLEGTFVLDQTVTVVGNAKAFAGNTIDGATVKYHVVRQARFPYWFWGRRPSFTEGGQEIAHGETKTDATGKFTVDFKAIADRQIKKEDKPVFEYAITADVTDINGETHSTTSSVSVGYTALLTTVEVAAEISKEKMSSIKISTKNLNGQPLGVKGRVKIDLLTSPRRPYISRYWALPDTQIIDEAIFRRDFPLYPFKEEDKEQNWVVKRTIMDKDFDTKPLPAINAGVDSNFLPAAEFKKYQTGVYRITVTTTDPTTGEKMEAVKHFMIYDLNDDVVPCNKTFFAWQDEIQYKITDIANITVGTATEMLHVLIEEELDGKLIKTTWMHLESINNYEVKLTEASRGNHFVHLTYALNNRAGLTTRTIVVPYSNKVLNVEYQTFKDKLEPGSDEEWRIKISGEKKEKVAAEIVSAMYDASLDQFVPNAWHLNLYTNRNPQRGFDAPSFGATVSTNFYNYTEGSNLGADEPHNYRQFNWFNFNFAEGGAPRPVYERAMPMSAMSDAVMAAPTAPRMRSGAPANYKAKKASVEMSGKIAGIQVSPTVKNVPPVLSEEKEKAPDLSAVKARTNLNETVFFFPELMTDANGDVVLKFKMNEALTRWKLMTLAHTTDLKVGYSERTLVTQKDLMLFPNAPRFLREGDEIELSAKISNLTDKPMAGSAQLLLFDAVTMKPVDDILDNKNSTLPFDMAGGLSTSVNWTLKIPLGKVQAIAYRIVAKAGNFSDGEENTLPVLTNRLLVTESLPLSIRGGESKKFTFQSLKTADDSKSLTHQALTLEFTQNPAWYAVQALPYLMEYPYECTEQIFSRFYANSLATNVANAHPKIKAVFDRWRTIDTKALQSNLTKNQELKSALLEETPWVLAAQNEEVQKKNVGLLFDLNKMANESANALRKMSERQLDNGGFAWFPGGRDSWFISQYILEGFGHLDALGVKNADPTKENMVNKTIVYCDNRFKEEYTELEKNVAKQRAKWEDDNLSSLALHYLYTKSLFPNNINANANAKEAAYYLGQAEKFWTKRGIYEQALIALAMTRNNKNEVTKAIVASLKERAMNSDELGMYWKSSWGYNWHEQPIETQALMVELFNEVGDAKAVENLKIWLLKNKQTNAWKTTKATASAVYALLRTGDNWLLEKGAIDITIGGTQFEIAEKDKEAGTGYFKTTFPKDNISSKQADIEVKNPNKSVSWGAMYWQYFENLDKIKDFKETPLTIVKQLFKQENADKGLTITPIANNAPLSIGDKIKVRIELRVDRNMEFVHMKDMRAAGFEPTNVLSQYKYQGGLGYYESTKDASTNFFFDYLPKGTYVFEYGLIVNNKGDMSNGITTIQCMYAPDFSSHSEGIRVKVK
ncbi:MAG: alpha-2-macroglobulin family protein [Saprospiraceae bacterium]|nr:alpha-2-macroglobulin family protein [Saprospiraceae bacterium]